MVESILVGVLLGAFAQEDPEPINVSLERRLAGSRDFASERLCGPNALLVAARLAGYKVTTADLDSVLPSTGPHSMQQVSEAATLLGIPNLAVYWEQGSDPDISTPLIVPLSIRGEETQHYVVLSGKVGDRFQVLDFGRPPGLTREAFLKSRWSGYALHIATDWGEIENLKTEIVRRHRARILGWLSLPIGLVGIVFAFRARRRWYVKVATIAERSE